MSIKAKLNKLNNYIKTYGFFKGFKIALQRQKSSKKAHEDLLTQINSIESIVFDVLNKYSTKSYNPSFTNEEKNIFIFWWDGFDSLPQIVSDCINRIEFFYSNEFNIIKLSKFNYDQYVNLNPIFIKKLNNRQITIQTFSDILRLNLISKLGGVWIDSTVLINNKLNLLDDLNKFGFITMSDLNTSNFISIDNITCNWSSFFIGGSKNNPLFNCLCDCYEEYLTTVNSTTTPTYFLTDIFITLCKKYKVASNILSIYPSVKTQTNMFYLSSHLNDKVSDKNKSIINNSSIQKLNWRIDVNKLKSNSLYKYAINKN